jgi:hypothetical protein
MQIDDFSFPDALEGPASPRERARQQRLRRAPRLIPPPEPEAEAPLLEPVHEKELVEKPHVRVDVGLSVR